MLNKNTKSSLQRQSSDLSDETSSYHISSTPDAESYFNSKAAMQQFKNPSDLEVIVSESSINMPGASALDENLLVLPLAGEIDIIDIDDPPSTLSVKSIARKSSFEALYDAVAENFPRDDALELATRDSFHATFEVPQRVSSFEKLYDRSNQEQLTGDQLVKSLTTGSMKKSG